MKKALTIGRATAALGMTLSVTPAANADSTADYVRGPRIIHVPQPDDDEPRASAVRDDDEGEAAPPAAYKTNATPRRVRVIPLRQSRRQEPAPRKPYAAALPPVERRAILSAPPLSDGPTPIRPTPDFGEKFKAAGEPSAAAEVPPQAATAQAAAPSEPPAQDPPPPRQP